jgi:hypothetical protein
VIDLLLATAGARNTNRVLMRSRMGLASCCGARGAGLMGCDRTAPARSLPADADELDRLGARRHRGVKRAARHRHGNVRRL